VWRPRILAKLGENGLGDLLFRPLSLPRKGGGRQTSITKSDLLDLKRLVVVFSGEAMAFADAAIAFGLADESATMSGLLESERAKTDLTAALAFRLLAEVDKHPWSRANGGPVSDTKLRSVASIGKNYLASIGLTPRLRIQSDFPR
jgi:hypothetical protein